MAEHSATPSRGQIQTLITADHPTAMATATIEDVVIPVEEELKRAAKKVEADLSKIKTKIHRYPAIFRSLISKDDRYFVPRVVAIGPYHHGALHLKEAEEVKRAAAYYFCRDLGQSVEEVYQKILSVAANARSCYADDVVASMGEGDFAAMMFHDGCFLLQFILNNTFDIVDVALQSWFNSNNASMMRDIFLLENQLPWQVLDILRSFRSIPVSRFICQCASSFDANIEFDKNPFVLDEIEYKPPHLLGLLWFYQSGLLNKPTESRTIDLSERDRIITSLPQCKSAIELAEMGIKLVANKKSHFRNMGISQDLLSGKLFLAPLVMDELNAYWLLNMVALEICSQGSTSAGDQPFVSSYVYLLAILMNREEDVHELRVKGILHGKFSNRHTLFFFKNLAQLIPLNIQYGFLMAQLEAYRRNRWMWIPIHKFVYNNFKTIITVFPIIGVLVGILKTLLSIKQHQQ